MKEWIKKWLINAFRKISLIKKAETGLFGKLNRECGFGKKNNICQSSVTAQKKKTTKRDEKKKYHWIIQRHHSSIEGFNQATWSHSYNVWLFLLCYYGLTTSSHLLFGTNITIVDWLHSTVITMFCHLAALWLSVMFFYIGKTVQLFV